jgi:hypothetical protein
MKRCDWTLAIRLLDNGSRHVREPDNGALEKIETRSPSILLWMIGISTERLRSTEMGCSILYSNRLPISSPEEIWILN